MNEKNYEAVLKALLKWKPTKEVPVFGILAIQNIVKCDLDEAIDIRNRLAYQGAVPNASW